MGIAVIEAGVIIWLVEDVGSLCKFFRLTDKCTYKTNKTKNKTNPTNEDIAYHSDLNHQVKTDKHTM